MKDVCTYVRMYVEMFVIRLNVCVLDYDMRETEKVKERK